MIVYARPPATPAPRRRPRPVGRCAAAAGGAPAPLFEFAPNMEIPAGQTGGRRCRRSSASRSSTNQRGRSRHRPGGRRLRARAVHPRLSGRHRDEAAGRHDARVPDALHDLRQGGRPIARASRVKYAKQPPATQLRWASLQNGALHIPAGAGDQRVDAEMTIGQDITLWSMLPHTHVRGKRWNYEATYPDGRKETLLSVPKYDFNWQTDYVFKQPLKLPKGTKLHATAWYDNSTANKSNPDPTKDVWWGDQTWEEMMFTGLTFSIDPRQDAPIRRGRDSKGRASWRVVYCAVRGERCSRARWLCRLGCWRSARCSAPPMRHAPRSASACSGATASSFRSRRSTASTGATAGRDRRSSSTIPIDVRSVPSRWWGPTAPLETWQALDRPASRRACASCSRTGSTSTACARSACAPITGRPSAAAAHRTAVSQGRPGRLAAAAGGARSRSCRRSRTRRAR